MPREQWISVIQKKESFKIPQSDVLHIEQSGKSLHIKTDSDLLESAGKIREIREDLEEPFYLCHAYLIINIERVVSMTEGKIIFDDKTELHLGRDSFTRTRKKFNKYLLGQW